MGIHAGFLSLFYLCIVGAVLACDSGDEAALRDFSTGLSPRPWSAANESADCCHWAGINCTGDSSTPSSSRRVEKLTLSNKGLTGMISDSLGNLSQLKTLDLSSNSLVGPIPKGLFAARSLETIRLGFNGLSGNISNDLANLSNLTRFDLSSNQLSGPIPDVFGSLGQNLNYFSLKTNNFSGPIPESLSSCTALNFLDLGSNSLSGTIRFNFSGMVSLKYLLIDSNRFSGPVPESVFSCTNLTVLALRDNRFGGEFPAGFGRLKSLESLLLSKTSFSNITAALTVLNQCSNLTFLQLDNNFQGEAMPADGAWMFPRLQTLSMQNSNISGFIPAWISRLSGLHLLLLSGNRLEGTIPAWFGEFKQILVLDLSGNMLTGDIPASLTRPGNPAFTNAVRQGDISSTPSTLDLSNNLLKGTSWRSIGNLKHLIALNLSHNGFTGSIPDNFSDMRNMELLDLSYNQLSGVIPSSLQNLNFINTFSVANNSLEGEVPSGGQFLTFDCSKFAGNPGLKFSKPFPCTSETPGSETPDIDSGDQSGVTFMYFPFGMGILAGFIPTVMTYAIRRYKKQPEEFELLSFSS